MLNKDTFLSNVIGLDYAREELFNTINWFKNSEKYEAQGIEVPRGILLYGDPGNGKSLIIREINKNLNDIPCFYFDNSTTAPIGTLNQLFKDARKYSKCIITIDEIDLLVDKEPKIIRLLQENLDGVKTESKNFLLLCACNYMRKLPDSLLRKGRIDKLIQVDEPSKEDIRKYLNYLLEKANIDNREEMIDQEVVNVFSSKRFVDVKAAFNDACLRFGKENINSYNLIQSALLLEENISPNLLENMDKNELYKNCIHEAGHCVVSLKYREQLDINSLRVNNGGGYYRCNFLNQFDSNTHYIDIQISLGGAIAQKLFFKHVGIGSNEDISRVNSRAMEMIESLGYKGFYNGKVTIENFIDTDYLLTQKEKARERIIKRCSRKVYWHLLKNKKLVEAIAKELLKKKYLTAREILEIESRHPLR